MNIGRREFCVGAFLWCVTGGCRSCAVSERVVIAHCGDPQLGFDPSLKDEEAYLAGLDRLEREIAKINEIRPDCVCFAGDMVNDWRRMDRDWPRLLNAIHCPCVVTVGNHDIPNPCSDDEIRMFSGVFGSDRFVQDVKGWRIISLNAQYERDLPHHLEYERWRNEMLCGLKSSGRPGIVLTHHPIALARADEADTLENYPATGRGELVDRMVDAGVRFVLAGHTHRLQSRALRGLPVLNAETTSNNFDGRPFGFRLLQAGGGLDYSWDFVAV